MATAEQIKALLKNIEALLISPCPINFPLTTLLPMAIINDKPNNREKTGIVILMAAKPKAPT